MAPFLRELSVNDGQLIYEMLLEIENATFFHNDANGISDEAYKLWLEKNAKMALGIDLGDWLVPQTTYWMFSDKTPVGYGRIRHFLNAPPKADSGHIGYAVACSQRGKEYGQALLRLLLAACEQRHIRDVQIGAHKENTHSNQVILHSGGILTRTTDTKNIYLLHRT